jgi:hypothetical protein
VPTPSAGATERGIAPTQFIGIFYNPFRIAIADELEIEAMQLGALLREKEELQRAIAPDTCLYTQHQALVISKVAESESFIVITGISAYRTFLFDC